MAVLLLLGLAAFHCSRAEVYHHQPCRDTGGPRGAGLVTVPDFGPLPLLLDVSCAWSRSGDGGRKVLLRVDSVRLPPEETRNSSLTLVVDGRVIDVPRNCVRCLEENFVTGERVELTYRSVLTGELAAGDPPSDGSAGDVGSFQVRYESFDPAACDGPPAQPARGFATVSGLGLGQEVTYGCDPPYDATGPDRAVCLVKDRTESPVPEWSVGPPKCQVTDCSSTVQRVVGRGALASPGFPLHVLPGALDCRWVLRAADRGGRIGLTLTFLQLSSGAGSFGTLTVSDAGGRRLASYGHASDKYLDLATDASKVVVTLTTNNTQTVKGGFYMEYRLLEAGCEGPASPEFGEVLFTSLSAGSWASYRCLPGYALAGETRTLCQNNRTWTPDAPTCLPDLASGDLSDPDLQLLSSHPATASSPEPKVAKPTRKAKAKAAGKTQKAAAKPKLLEQSSSEVDDSGSGNGDEGFTTDEQKSDGKQPLAVNAAQDKSPKIKGNLTSVKQRPPTPDSVPGILDSGGPLSGRDRQEEEEDEGKLLDVLEEEEAAREEEVLGLKTYVLIGVTTSVLLVVTALVVALVVYRKRFPVRMGLGRRFSTFENPVYASKDAQHTRELKRLTV